MKKLLLALALAGSFSITARAADITSPQIVKWSNERSRVISDTLVRVYNALKAYQTDWAAQGINAAIVSAGSSNNVGDGYTTDGRQPVTGLQLQNLNASINQVVTALDTTNVTGVGTPPMTTVNAIQVNGSNR